jgi:hypothetical protein
LTRQRSRNCRLVLLLAAPPLDPARASAGSSNFAGLDQRQGKSLGLPPGDDDLHHLAIGIVTSVGLFIGAIVIAFGVRPTSNRHAPAAG